MTSKKMERNVHRSRPAGWKLMMKRGFLLLRLTGIVLFIFILTRIDLREMWEHLITANAGLFLAGAGFQVLLLFLKAYRWYLLSPGARQQGNLAQSFGEFFESYAIGVVTPGRMGEILKAGYSRQRSGIVGSGLRVIVERGLDLGFFLLIAGASLAFASLVEVSYLWGWLVIVFGSGITTIAVILLLSKKALNTVNRFLLKVRIIKEPVEYTGQPAGDNLLIFLLSAASNLSYFISCYFLGLAMQMDVLFLYLSGGVAIAGLLNMLPVTVMGLGTRELTFLYVFNEAARAKVMAFSGLVFLVAQAGGGLISLVAGQAFLMAAKKKRNER